MYFGRACSFCIVLLALNAAGHVAVSVSGIEIAYRECEPIRIEMCKHLGYNDTSMPNLVGNEIQSEAEYTLQSFSPLIEYVCSSQLKLFLCATYVPMCTSKAPIPIGPCRSLCESVRSRCDPVLKGFGYNWPPALDCNLFPKENNQETMCMEGPGEAQEIPLPVETYNHPVDNVHFQQNVLKSNIKVKCHEHSMMYMTVHRTWRCMSLCGANNLFDPEEKSIADIWINTCTYAALGLVLAAVIYLLKSDSKILKPGDSINSIVLSPLVWCHTMVVFGWTVRFVSGRVEPCAYDPQMSNSSQLVVDSLSNGPCTATFILRYYFGMAASAWWAILCLGWHREVRQNSPDISEQLLMGGSSCTTANTSDQQIKQSRIATCKSGSSITSNNLARFLAWGLPAFQTAAVIVTRLVDADDLLGACFVGNQSDKSLQILVATPLFCYWIFGSMNLVSGYLVHRRNQAILRTSNLPPLHIMMQSIPTISGSFLFIYCLPFTLLLMAIIYEFANIDIWISISMSNNGSTGNETPMWPFMARALFELILPILCSGRILGPRISYLLKRQLFRTTRKTFSRKIQPHHVQSASSSIGFCCRKSNKPTSLTSIQSVRQPKNLLTSHIKNEQISAIVLTKTPNKLTGSNKTTKNYHPQKFSKGVKTFYLNGDETIL